MGSLFFIFWAFLLGILLIFQSGANNSLKTDLGGNPYLSALVSGSISFVLVLTINLSSAQPLAELTKLPKLEWWKFIGGIIGALYMVTIVIVGPKIGAANMFTLFICGQLVGAILVDSFGWFNYPVTLPTWNRIIGLFLVLAGVLLINYKTIFRK